MKKIINSTEAIVNEMLEGIVKAHPEHIKRVEGFNVLTRVNSPIQGKVALISGGGSGHEPSHAGFVGKGMLDAAVAGEVFTSPTPDQVLEGIKAIGSDKGVLLVIKNYSGDVMNFEMAAEMAEMEGIKVDKVVVNDDVAVENSTYTTGRRGVAGTIFVHKIAGAAAEEGKSLEEVQKIAQKVVDNTRTMGMSLGACTVPAVGKPSFTLGEDEIEMGLGIHGEPGTHREKLSSADELTEYMLGKILEDMSIEKAEEVGVIVNGLGATPLMELYIVNKKLHSLLEEKEIKVNKTLIGNYMTSLEMPGFSISVIKLDEELKRLLNAEADTPALKEI
ncbi:MAG: dihydroxyacetone kinase subunit DhaK [Tepidibacter sp.]|jgi:dihydroxyacetone kinase-like protein|uniref:dihydroxyacetone kinase subunit DhaK n=1 Tax=Tepidibacter sp. TaxID=2529387 RepID=UPI0025D0FA9B|nr:dihydroxyacetone kinase subunit DhaK [Tepidibacter sp.]MCT4509948.1 dihydroxyacetone kinase subunit DhaK [Tepidibacter sp.]